MIGERLSEVRKDHGDTQADLAAKLNTSIYAVRSWVFVFVVHIILLLVLN